MFCDELYHEKPYYIRIFLSFYCGDDHNIASHIICMLCISRKIANHEGLTVVGHEGLTLNATRGILR